MGVSGAVVTRLLQVSGAFRGLLAELKDSITKAPGEADHQPLSTHSTKSHSFCKEKGGGDRNRQGTRTQKHPSNQVSAPSSHSSPSEAVSINVTAGTINNVI